MAKYTRLKSGYMGQLVDWPEVITEGQTIEECRDLLYDALQEMILAYILPSRNNYNMVGGVTPKQA
jgi:predicted RNase H-like HicB family nuclease